MSRSVHWSLRMGAVALLLAASYWPRSRGDAARTHDPAVAMRADESHRTPRSADTGGAAELLLSNQ